MKVPFNYTDYLRAIEHYRLDEHAEHIMDNPLIREQILHLPAGFGNLMPALYVLDLTRRKYLYVNSRMEQLTGYRNEAMLEGGTDFGLTLWKKKDLGIFSRHIFPDNLRVLRSAARANRELLHFECNYRIRAANGEQKNLLQQSIYVATSQDGLPLISMGILTDISHLRRDSSIIHVIRKDTGRPMHPERTILLQEQYFSDEQQQLLSSREVEVLKWICEGIDSKAIAKKLCISLNTVNNHRRRIIAKTRCRTTLALYKYAIMHGYL